ncbi:hypothetical protein NBRC116595_33330 [Aliiglaciecola sp. NS0011-25]
MSLISGHNTKLIYQKELFTLTPIAKWVKAAVFASVAGSFAFSATAQNAPTEN